MGEAPHTASLAEAVVGHLLLMGVGVPLFNILGAPLKRGGRLN